MTDLTGRTLGSYRVLGRVGAGGMGEVYRARDTRLDRDVAIKVLIGEHGDNPELRARFEVEARAISRLNHPNICTLFDVGEDGGTHFLVMELLEGETLAKRLERGPLPLEQVRALGAEIAGALAAAHRCAVIHRDLKPGNVMLTKNGVKLLDFGLARLHAASHGLDPAAAPTRAEPLTAAGQVMGTFQYMSPEQAEGREADARSDVFAFGAVLYEMVTGRRAFDGASRASVLAALLRSEPPPVTSVAPGAGERLEWLINGCLEKDPERRWQSAADVQRLLLELGQPGGEAPAGVGGGRTGWRRWREVAAWAVAGAALAALALAPRGGGKPVGMGPGVRLRALAPGAGDLWSGAVSTSLAVSPTGDRVAYVMVDGAASSLWVWSLADGSARQLAGSDGGSSPFFSPDGAEIGYFARGKLRRVPAAGGPDAVICEAPFGSVGSWGTAETIVFAEWAGGREGLYRVPAAGGAATRVPLAEELPPMPPVFPQLLPDGRHAIYLSAASSVDKRDRSVCVVDLETGTTRAVTHSDVRAVWAADRLFVVQDGTLSSLDLPLDSLAAGGPPVVVAEGVASFVPSGGAEYAVSADGSTVVYRHALPRTELAWFDRAGRRTATLVGGRCFGHFDLSRDGRSVIAEIADPVGGNRDAFVFDAGTGIGSRATFDPVDALFPVWSPRSDAFAYGSARSGPPDLYRQAVAGSGSAELLLAQRGAQLPADWSPDGLRLAFVDYSPVRTPPAQVWLLPLVPGGAPEPLLDVPYSTYDPEFSPDGESIAFTAEDSGHAEVYVAPLDAPAARRRVSPAGGSLPHWTKGGRELIYLQADGYLMAAPLAETAGGPQPLPLFRVDRFRRFDFEVTADGERILVNTTPDLVADRAVTVVTGVRTSGGGARR